MKKVVSVILVLCLVLNATSAYAAPLSGVTTSTLPQCVEEINDAKFKVELKELVETFFIQEVTGTNIQEIVQRQWSELHLDAILLYEINSAVAKVKRDTGYWGRFTSNWSGDQAKNLAGDIIEQVFGDSSRFENSIRQLTENVATEFSTQLKDISDRSSFYAVDCLEHFIDRQYSQTIVDAFGKDIEKSTQDVSHNLGDDLSNLPPDMQRFIESHKTGVGGTTYLLFRNQIRRLVVDKIVARVFQQVGERVAARVVEGMIPVLDVFVLFQTLSDFLNPDAALQEIQSYLEKPEIRQRIQQDVATLTEQYLSVQSSAIPDQIASDISDKWQVFKYKFDQALSFSKDLPEFRQVLETNDPAKVSSLLGILLDVTGRNQLREYINDGSFKRVLSLPESTYSVLRMRDGLPLLIEWANLAGDQVENVVSLELYKHLSPTDLDRELLTEIISLKDPSIIDKLSLLEVDSIRKLLLISRRNLVSVATHLSSNDLQELADYLDVLEPDQANQLLKLLKEDPLAIRNPDAINHILNSPDPRAAIRFWEAPKTVFSFAISVFNTFNGVISWQLLSDKYGNPIFFIIIGLPILAAFAFAATTIIWLCRNFLEAIQQFIGKSDANKSGSSTEPEN
jgi:hypothetical protein